MSLIDSWTEVYDASDATDYTFTVPRDVPAGSLLVVAVGRGSSGTVTGLSAVRGNSWTLDGAGPHSGGSLNGVLATTQVATALVAGDTFTVSASASTSRWALAAAVFDDVAFPVNRATSGLVEGSGATSATVGPITLDVADTLVLQSVVVAGGDAPLVANGNTIAAQAVSAGGSANRAVALAYRYGTGASHSSTIDFSGSGNYVSVLSAYAVGADTTTPPPDPTYTVSVWDGAAEVPASLSVWDGAVETAATPDLA